VKAAAFLAVAALALSGCIAYNYGEKLERCAATTIESIGDPDVERRFLAVLPELTAAYERGEHHAVRLALNDMPRDMVFAVASVCADQLLQRSIP
jgi:hypothetical protein